MLENSCLQKVRLFYRDKLNLFKNLWLICETVTKFNLQWTQISYLASLIIIFICNHFQERIEDGGEEENEMQIGSDGENDTDGKPLEEEEEEEEEEESSEEEEEEEAPLSKEEEKDKEAKDNTQV